MKSIYEKLGGTYRQSGDYLIPDIALPESSPHTLGKYGRMRRKYLKEHRYILFNQMVLDGTLYPHLAEIDHSCNTRMEQIISAIAMTEGVNERLKEQNPMLWVQQMNNIRSRAEEIVLQELIFTS